MQVRGVRVRWSIILWLRPSGNNDSCCVVPGELLYAMLRLESLVVRQCKLHLMPLFVFRGVNARHIGHPALDNAAYTAGFINTAAVIECRNVRTSTGNAARDGLKQFIFVGRATWSTVSKTKLSNRQPKKVGRDIHSDWLTIRSLAPVWSLASKLFLEASNDCPIWNIWMYISIWKREK